MLRTPKRPRSATSLWSTNDLRSKLPGVAQRWKLDLGTVVKAITEDFIAHVEPLDPQVRPCFVGTLFAYPGMDGSMADPTGKRTDVLKPGSRRMSIILPRGTQEHATQCGLLLHHQWSNTTPAKAPTHERSIPGKRVGSEPGRPLTDAVLTALIQEVGILQDEELSSFYRQVITQKLAQDLWNVAASEVTGISDREEAGRTVSKKDLRNTRRLLKANLPGLLVIDNREFKRMEQLLTDWEGTLAGLAALYPWRSPSTLEANLSTTGQVRLPNKKKHSPKQTADEPTLFT